MVTDLRKLTECIEKFSSPKLAVPGDFVGIQVGPRNSLAQERTKIRKCAITRYATPQVIVKATRDSADAIIAYDGLLSHPVKAFTGGLLDKIRLLIENRIVLYIVHTSWLSAECGVNDTLAEILGLVVVEAFNVGLKGKTVPLGRVCTFGKNPEQNVLGNSSSVSLSDFVTMVSHRLATDEINYVGGSQSHVRKILLLSGEYGQANILKLAKSTDIDTFVTGNISRGVAVLANDLGINYICITQDPVESLGMRRLMQLLSIDAPEVEFTYIESGLLWKKYDSTQLLATSEG
jgi:dinuclear metal center YbgI/SA1388 family protein